MAKSETNRPRRRNGAKAAAAAAANEEIITPATAAAEASPASDIAAPPPADPASVAANDPAPAAPPQSAPAQAPQMAHSDAELEAETQERYEQAKRSDLTLRDLQKMTVEQLHVLAKEEGVEDYIGLARPDLIYEVLTKHITKQGLMYGEGVLEVLPDGFGFLRSPMSPTWPGPMTSTSARRRSAASA